MNGLRRSAFARAAWPIWRALLLLDTVGLLAVGLYIAFASTAAGPSATPLLMAGLLSLCVMVLALVSAVDAVLWAIRARPPWWRRVVLVALAPAGAAVVFLLAVYASEPESAGAMKWVWLTLFVLSVLAAQALNAHAIRRYRGTD